jgi:succinyl-CoA synthetase alpha subunit
LDLFLNDLAANGTILIVEFGGNAEEATAEYLKTKY